MKEKVIKFFKNISLKVGTRGGVLIEFALALPMLVLIVYFFLDISVVEDIQQKNHRVCSIIEQLSRVGHKKKVTKEDFLTFSKAAILTIAGMPKANKSDIAIDIIWTCLKGTEDGLRKIMWKVHTKMLGDDGLNPFFVESDSETLKLSRIMQINGTVDNAQFSNLKLNTGQLAVIVELFASRSRDDNFNMFAYRVIKWPKVLGYSYDFFIPTYINYTDEAPL